MKGFIAKAFMAVVLILSLNASVAYAEDDSNQTIDAVNREAIVRQEPGTAKEQPVETRITDPLAVDGVVAHSASAKKTAQALLEEKLPEASDPSQDAAAISASSDASLQDTKENKKDSE